jgi:hypothetical protein
MSIAYSTERSKEFFDLVTKDNKSEEERLLDVQIFFNKHMDEIDVNYQVPDYVSYMFLKEVFKKQKR